MAIRPESIYPIFNEPAWINQWEKYIDSMLMNDVQRMARQTVDLNGRKIIRICFECIDSKSPVPTTAKLELAMKYRDVGWKATITHIESGAYLDLYIPIDSK